MAGPHATPRCAVSSVRLGYQTLTFFVLLLAAGPKLHGAVLSLPRHAEGPPYRLATGAAAVLYDGLKVGTYWHAVGSAVVWTATLRGGGGGVRGDEWSSGRSGWIASGHAAAVGR